MLWEALVEPPFRKLREVVKGVQKVGKLELCVWLFPLNGELGNIGDIKR